MSCKGLNENLHGSGSMLVERHFIHIWYQCVYQIFQFEDGAYLDQSLAHIIAKLVAGNLSKVLNEDLKEGTCESTLARHDVLQHLLDHSAPDLIVANIFNVCDDLNFLGCQLGGLLFAWCEIACAKGWYKAWAERGA